MNTNSNITVGALLECLREKLACNQKVIATLTGLNESTLLANSQKALDEVKTAETGKRLLLLYYVVHHLVSKGVDATVIKESIQQFVHQGLDGTFDSVISALVSEKYNMNVLVTIAEMGFDKYGEKLAARNELY